MISLAVYLAAFVIVTPLWVWFRYVTWVSRQPPGQRVELTKASHGAGMLALSYILAQQLGPSIWNPFIAVPLAVMVLWGGLWFVTSGLAVRLYGSQGPLDAVTLVRSLVKIAIGGAALHFIPFDIGQLLYVLPRVSDLTASLVFLAWIAGLLIGWWCIVTGSAKCLLLAFSRLRRPRKLPKPVQNPRGSARDASRAEARSAMRGKGARTNETAFWCA